MKKIWTDFTKKLNLERYSKEDWVGHENEINQDDVFVIKIRAPLYIEAINHWIDGLTWTGPEDVYYDPKQAVASYIRVTKTDKLYVEGELVLIPLQTFASVPLKRTNDNCYVKIRYEDLYHKLTPEELKPKHILWADYISARTINE